MLVYRRLATPLHAARAGMGALWALALIAAALLLDHPLVLGTLTVAVLAAGAAAGLSRELARVLRAALAMGLALIAVNVLVSRQGLTVFARLGDLGPFGRGDLTWEALVYGGVIALKLTLVMLVCALASLALDPDELLRGLRRVSFHSALTVSLATRMVGVLAADAQRMAEAQRTRPGGAARGARARLALLSAAVSRSLDRAMDVAATLELRGFAIGRHAGRQPARRSRHDLAFGACAAAVAGLALLGRLQGTASFTAYPRLRLAGDAATWALAAALAAAALLPFCDRRGVGP